jgi:hypothetical protein
MYAYFTFKKIFWGKINEVFPFFLFADFQFIRKLP